MKVYASGAADGTHFIAMELVEGETLGKWLKRGPPPPPEALRICVDVARALEHVWNRVQFMHRGGFERGWRGHLCTPLNLPSLAISRVSGKRRSMKNNRRDAQLQEAGEVVNEIVG